MGEIALSGHMVLRDDLSISQLTLSDTHGMQRMARNTPKLASLSSVSWSDEVRPTFPIIFRLKMVTTTGSRYEMVCSLTHPDKNFVIPPRTSNYTHICTIEKLYHLGLGIPLFLGLPLVNMNKIIENLT